MLPRPFDDPSARRGRPRQQGVDLRVEAAVLALLRRGGPSAVTVEAVAQEANVAKTTVYRRHANRADLLRTTLAKAIGRPGQLSVGTVREKLRHALEEAWRQMTDVLGPGGLAAILGDSDPEFTEVFRAALRPYDEALVAQIRQDSASGLIRPDVDADGMVSLLLGAYLGELVRRGQVDDDWMDRSFEMLWIILTAPR
jgi:AcrR family transcriptional regulator